MKKYDYLVYSAVGLVALFFLLVAFNYLIGRGAIPALDLTEGKLYTLSSGTKKILQNLSSPVKVKLYASRGETVPVPLRGFTQRVEDLVREFKKESGANLVVELYNPKPDSEEEDAAQLDGIEPQQLASGESFYLGAAVSQLERKQAIPAITPQRERLLEYDLVRAIARVGVAERPKIGLMAGCCAAASSSPSSTPTRTSTRRPACPAFRRSRRARRCRRFSRPGGSRWIRAR